MQRSARRWSLTLAATLAGGAALAALAGCDRANYAEARQLTGGDPERGRVYARSYGCGSCHTIAGVPGAKAVVGPPLAGLAQRAYVAGVVPNTPDNLVTWIRHPQEIDPRTAMPDVGVTESHARDIAAYLYSLR
jgi:cytochrome c